MEVIRKKYIVDERNKKVAVQISIKTYEQIEEILENYGLVQLMDENEGGERLTLSEAKEFYSRIR